MSAVLSSSSGGVWAASWRRLKTDRVGMACMVVVGLFLVLVLLAATNLVAAGWQKEIGVPNAPPTLLGPQPPEDTGAIAAPKGPNVDLSDIDPLAPRYAEWAERAKAFKTEEAVRSQTLPLGGDRLGRDVLAKVIKGAEVSIFVGLAAALAATLIGTLLGAVSGFFGGKVGDFLEWVYNVFTAIPSILLIFAFAAIFHRGVGSVVAILALTGWTGIYRLIRAEFIKHRGREYVRSAEAIGASQASRMFKHILPNVSHVALVQLSLHVVSFIKSEVILSYLGLGVGVDQVSWGTMLAEAQNEMILGYWWQLGAVTVFMAVFVTAFALFTDALRDALDPKLRGLE
ncbi:ABC transporter permease [Roseateles sp.]|uniref:ABC transporter permease n=1 Tax=Roseateles sp. TaxID=1971397 RepID=UPI002DFFE2BA|nr:ABC transporter permease [Roseateles sp.]